MRGELEFREFSNTTQNAEFSVRSFAFWCVNWPEEIRLATLEIASATMTEERTGWGHSILHPSFGKVEEVKANDRLHQVSHKPRTRATQLLAIVYRVLWD